MMMIGVNEEEHQEFGILPVQDANSYPSQNYGHRHHNYVVYPPLSSSTAIRVDMKGPARGEDCSFPVRLYCLLDVLQQDGFAHLASWQPHGRCFVVHNPTEFSEKVLPLWFKQSRFGSFQRQLNLYGFRRLKQGRDKGGYWHESFMRGFPELAHDIKRAKAKKSRAGDSDEDLGEPNFYSIPFLPMTYPMTYQMGSIQAPPANACAPKAVKENGLAHRTHCPWPGPTAPHLPAPDPNFDPDGIPVVPIVANMNKSAPAPVPPTESFLDLNIPLLETKLFASPQAQPLTPCLSTAPYRTNYNHDGVAIATTATPPYNASM